MGEAPDEPGRVTPNEIALAEHAAVIRTLRNARSLVLRSDVAVRGGQGRADFSFNQRVIMAVAAGSSVGRASWEALWMSRGMGKIAGSKTSRATIWSASTNSL